MIPVTLFGLPGPQLVSLFAAGTAVLGVLYVLKQRRRRVEVPFARLWQRVLKETESVTLWQHLRRWLSLLLQVLILLLLALALGDPRLGQGQGKHARTLALLVDASASMQAVDGSGTTRLARAREAARRLVRDLGGDDLAVVVALDAQPAPLGGLSQDERELLAQVDAVVARDEPADLPRALRLCRDLLKERKNPQVVLISDGGFDDATLGRLALASAGVELRYVPIGRPEEFAGNVAITSFSVRRYRHNRLSYEVLLELSYLGGKAPAPVQLELLQEGEVVDLQHLTLNPGEPVQRIYPNLAGSGAHLLARVRLEKGTDPLPLDDRAYAVLPERRHQRVLVVTRGNLFLEGALLSASAGDESQLRIDKVAPGAYEPAQAAAHDVVIFDDFTPPAAPDADALYLNPQGEGSPAPIIGSLAAPLVTDAGREHPLLRWVTLKDLNVSRASVFRLGPGDVAVAAMLGKPIIVARQRQQGPGGRQRRQVLVGFDLRQSDLPLRVAFPVLLVNALDWFAGELLDEAGSFSTGRLWRIPLGRERDRTGESGATLTLPPGKENAEAREVFVPVQDGYALYFGRRAGYYELQRPQVALPPLLLAANLADATESAARIRPQLALGPGQFVPPPEPGAGAIKRVLWPYLVLLAMLLLFVEWWTYHRRWTV